MPNVMLFPNTEKTLTIMTNFVHAVSQTDVGHPPYKVSSVVEKNKGIRVYAKKGSKPFFISMDEYMNLNITDDEWWNRISTSLKTR